MKPALPLLSTTLVGSYDKDMQAIPGLIKAEFRLVESRFSRVMAELADLRTAMDDRFEAVLRAVAETVAERGKPD
jgi:hypothetical protein